MILYCTTESSQQCAVYVPLGLGAIVQRVCLVARNCNIILLLCLLCLKKRRRMYRWPEVFVRRLLRMNFSSYPQHRSTVYSGWCRRYMYRVISKTNYFRTCRTIIVRRARHDDVSLAPKSSNANRHSYINRVTRVTTWLRQIFENIISDSPATAAAELCTTLDV